MNKKGKNYNLFLDDVRSSRDVFRYTGNEVYINQAWTVVRNYDDFTSCILENDLPNIISFDHDLADEHYKYLQGEIPYHLMVEKTGYDCAKWLVDYCSINMRALPQYLVHSMNPVGRVNIIKLFESYNRFLRREI